MTQVNKHPSTPKKAAECCGPIDELLDAELFKALGDPTRLLLLACLAKCARPCSVTEIAACCSVDLSVVSRHLALLERAGIVASEKQGRAVFYAVRYQHLSGQLGKLARAISAYDPAINPRKGNCCAKP